MKIESSVSEIITAKDIQGAYLQFYPNIMQYLWSMKVVTTLANLEIAIYKAFPDKDEMERYLNSLEIEIRDTFNDEEDPKAEAFKKSFEHLKNYVESYKDLGYDIYNVPSITSIDDIKNASEPEEEPTEKKTLHVGKLVTR